MFRQYDAESEPMRLKSIHDPGPLKPQITNQADLEQARASLEPALSRASAAEEEVMRLRDELSGLHGELKHRDEAVKYAIEQVKSEALKTLVKYAIEQVKGARPRALNNGQCKGVQGCAVRHRLECDSQVWGSPSRVRCSGTPNPQPQTLNSKPSTGEECRGGDASGGRSIKKPPGALHHAPE